MTLRQKIERDLAHLHRFAGQEYRELAQTYEAILETLIRWDAQDQARREQA